MDFLYILFGILVLSFVGYLCYLVTLRTSSTTTIVNNTRNDVTSVPGYQFITNKPIYDASNNTIPRSVLLARKREVALDADRAAPTALVGSHPYTQLASSTSAPYATTPIKSVDDYEYNLVFQNESDQELSTTLRNKLMSQYPMDWTTLPPSAVQFQNGQREGFESGVLKEGFQAQTADPYSAIVDNSLTPPDTLAVERAERQILQTYQPKHVGDLTTYDVDDAMTLIKKIYEKKGEVPTVVQKEHNVYEIIGTRKKDEKIVYDETDNDAFTTADPPVIERPQAAADKSAGADPFFRDQPDTHKERWNYRQWTPGLQRMFAPTEPREEWY